MGKRVHVAKKYEIEYGGTTAFNWKQDEFISLLGTLGCSVCEYNNEDYSAGDFEVDAEQYKEALEQMKAYVKDPEHYENGVMDGDDIRRCAEALEETAEEILETMQSYYDEADKHDGYLHFSAW